MATQVTEPNLFTLAPHSNDTTSREAAKRIVPHKARLRQAVYEFIRSRADFGATDQEICEGTGISENTVRPRRGELLKLGLIVETDEVRLTAARRPAKVWRVAS